MKRIISLLLCAVMLFLLSACGQKTEDSVVITIPAEYVSEDLTDDDCKQMAEEGNYDSVTLNDDGSLTYTMSEERYEAFIQSAQESDLSELESIVSGGMVPGLTNIEANDDLTDFKITVSADEVDENLQYIAGYILNIGSTFQMYNGGESQSVHVAIVNEAGEVLYEQNS